MLISTNTVMTRRTTLVSLIIMQPCVPQSQRLYSPRMLRQLLCITLIVTLTAPDMQLMQVQKQVPEIMVAVITIVLQTTQMKRKLLRAIQATVLKPLLMQLQKNRLLML